MRDLQPDEGKNLPEKIQEAIDVRPIRQRPHVEQCPAIRFVRQHRRRHRRPVRDDHGLSVPDILPVACGTDEHPVKPSQRPALVQPELAKIVVLQGAPLLALDEKGLEHAPLAHGLDVVNVEDEALRGRFLSGQCRDVGDHLQPGDMQDVGVGCDFAHHALHLAGKFQLRAARLERHGLFDAPPPARSVRALGLSVHRVRRNQMTTRAQWLQGIHRFQFRLMSVERHQAHTADSCVGRQQVVLPDDHAGGQGIRDLRGDVENRSIGHHDRRTLPLDIR